MFKNFIFSFKKSRILSKIAKNENNGFDMQNFDFEKITKGMVNQNKNEKDLLNSLFELLEKDKFTMQLLHNHDRNFDDLRKIIEKLKLNGAGQIVNGHYVPVSSIAFLDTLQILLQYWNGENFEVDNFDDYNSNLFIANKMLTAF